MHQLVLRDEIRATDIVPAEDGRAHFFLEGLANVEDAGGAGTEEPLVGIGRKEVDVFDAGWKSSQGLNSVNAKRDVASAKVLADAGEVDAPAGDEMAGSQRHQPGVFIHLTLDVDPPDTPKLPDIHETHLNTFGGEGHP